MANARGCAYESDNNYQLQYNIYTKQEE